MTIETELPAVKVKPLEWKDGIGLSTAQTNIVACYSVWDVDDEFWLCSLVDGRFPSMEAAKSAAQADYERRILSALVPSTTAESRCEELVKALERSMVAINDWLHVYAPDECREADVAESRARLRENGTLWYIANVQEQNRDAIASHRKSNAAMKELGKGDGR